MKKKPKPRGFAAMDPDKQREIASMGGKAAARGNGHKWTREEAVAAGRKGGLASQGGGAVLIPRPARRRHGSARSAESSTWMLTR